METLFFLQGKFSVLDKLIILENCTEDDYWTLSSEDLKVEFARGRLYIHSPASIRHELIFEFLLRYINHFLEENGNAGKMLGSRVAIKLPNGHRPEPDLMYLEEGSYDPQSTTIFEGVPPWIIEILSPSTRNHDRGDKLDWYREAGVKEVWLIDPIDNQVVIYLYNEKTNNYESAIGRDKISPHLFDLELQVDWLWDLPKLSDVI